MSLPPEMTRPAGGGPAQSTELAKTPPRLDFRPAGLPAVFGGLVGLGRYCSFLQLLEDPARARGVDVDAGAHRARQRDAADVAALGRGRLGADDLVEEDGIVLGEVPLVEALLADRDVDVRASVGAVLELAGLRLAHGLRHLEGDGAGLRVRHLAARSEDA